MTLARDVRKRVMLEASVASDGDVPLFASPGLLAHENLDLLMARTSQMREEAPT